MSISMHHAKQVRDAWKFISPSHLIIHTFTASIVVDLRCARVFVHSASVEHHVGIDSQVLGTTVLMC